MKTNTIQKQYKKSWHFTEQVVASAASAASSYSEVVLITDTNNKI